MEERNGLLQSSALGELAIMIESGATVTYPDWVGLPNNREL
jgi:hypothetical protein